MVTAEYLRTLVDFHYWARDRMLAEVEQLTPEQYARPMGNSFASVRETCNHLYLGEWIWLTRWNGQAPPMPPKEEHPQSFADLKAAWSAHEVLFRGFVNGLGDVGHFREIDYKNLAGDSFRSPLWQMIAHVVNHATYHRGQVTTMLRQLGVAKVQATDMMVFFRSR